MDTIIVRCWIYAPPPPPTHTHTPFLTSSPKHGRFTSRKDDDRKEHREGERERGWNETVWKMRSDRKKGRKSEADRQTDGQTDRRTDRQTDRRQEGAQRGGGEREGGMRLFGNEIRQEERQEV